MGSDEGPASGPIAGGPLPKAEFAEKKPGCSFPAGNRQSVNDLQNMLLLLLTMV